MLRKVKGERVVGGVGPAPPYYSNVMSLPLPAPPPLEKHCVIPPLDLSFPHLWKRVMRIFFLCHQ